ncbi:PTS sugar transporter subunit IIA [Companilactobacillus zhachilii]|uniref:PTS sugar transporter subunit IIA n=1 Tax=Companilactobacillus zhachilii TaxID=2304606 RepID=UPI00192277DA|nr:PTS sugar transporter subunit IIA [Companilactobacillus zhachilii]MBL3530996.1 PTS sugar transporter subunit IIA [Companilactobacillus zhachilii]
MFKIFRKNHTTANVELEDNNQLSALKLAAKKTAEEFNVDEQNIQSSIFASAASGNIIIENRAVFMYATNDKKSRAHTMMITFKNPVAWGNDKTPVDYLIVGMFPSDTTQATMDALTEKITNIMHDKSDQLDDIKFNDGDLNKLNQAFTD